jgi:hypothetical protein
MAISNSENVTGDGNGASISLTSWTPDTSDLILVGVALLDETDSVSSITGNGLTFTYVNAATSSNYRMEVWKAQGGSPSTGQITVNMTSGGSNVICIASRFTGVDTITNVEDSATATGSNDDDMLVTGITASGAGSWIIGFGTHGTTDLTVPGGETAILINQTFGGGPNTVCNSEWYEVASGAGDYQIGDTADLSANTNWAAVGVAIRLTTTLAANVNDAAAITEDITSAATLGGIDEFDTATITEDDIVSIVSPPILNFTNLGDSANPDINDTTAATSYSNTSWTPPTTGIIVVFVETRDDGFSSPATPTMSGNNLTWTQIGSTLDCDGAGNGLSLFAADAAGATTGATTVDFGSNIQVHCVASFFQVTGVDISGGIASAFVQTPTNTGTGTEGTITLAAAGASDNRPAACFWHVIQESTTPRTNWTELDDMTGSGQVRGVETQYRDDAFETTASGSWSTSADWAGMAAEIKALVTGDLNINVFDCPNLETALA